MFSFDFSNLQHKRPPPKIAFLMERDATRMANAATTFVKSFDLFHARVDRAFESMERKRSAPEGRPPPPWRTSKEYEVKLGANIEEEEEEDDDDDKEEEEEDARDDCLFGTKTETRRSIGKCDRLEREEYFDRDDMFAVGFQDKQLLPGVKRASGTETKTVVPDHEKFPLKYTKYTFDEPVLVGGGVSGNVDEDEERGRTKRKKEDDVGKVSDMEEEEEGEEEEDKMREDAEATRKVEEPRVMRGSKNKGANRIDDRKSRKKPKRVTRSSSMALRSVTAQEAENEE